MEQNKDKDDKKPALPIPTLKDAKSAPQLRIKGLAQSGMSLLERLKAFKKKDLAFILAGLGVLFLAPLAEHFMMAPEGDQGGFKEGFGYRDGAGQFGKGTSPYDGGYNGLAPGGAIGNGSDVITPLNVRDPAALVLGPGATQQPPAASTTPPAAPPKSDSGGDWKDALKESAARAAGAAAPKAALPMPKVPLSAGGLRGLGAVSGGGGGSFSLPAINASNVPNRGTVGNSPSPTGGGGIRGVARGQDQGGDQASLDALRKAAANAAGAFNGPGSAAVNLEQAASQAMPGNGSADSGAGQGAGGGDKASGQSGDKSSKNADGQSLAFLKAKQEQEKAIEFEWKKKEAADTDLLWYKLRDKMAEELIMTPLKALTADFAKKLSKLGASASGTINCCPPGTDCTKNPGAISQINTDDLVACHTQNSSDDTNSGGQKWYQEGNATDRVWGSQDCDPTKAFTCSGATDPNKPPPADDPALTSGFNGGVFNNVSLNTLCTTMDGFIRPPTGASPNQAMADAAGALKAVATPLATADAALNTGMSGSLPCNASPVDGSNGNPIRGRLGIRDDGQTDDSNAAGTWHILNDAYAKMQAVVVRDKGAADLAAAGRPADPPHSVAEQKSVSAIIEAIRAKVNPPPPAPPASADANDVAGLAALKTAMTQTFPPSSPVDTDFNGVAGALTALATPKGQIQTGLQQTKAALALVDQKMGDASSKLTALRTSNVDQANTMSKYKDGLQTTRDSLTGKLKIAVAEYNRQFATADGVLRKETDLRGIVQTLDTNVKRDLATGSGTPKTLPDLVRTVIAPVTAADFPTKTGLPITPAITGPFAPFSARQTDAANAMTNPDPNITSVTAVNTKLNGVAPSVGSGTDLAP